MGQRPTVKGIVYPERIFSLSSGTAGSIEMSSMEEIYHGIDDNPIQLIV